MLVMHQAVPVVQDGETIAVLYGIMSLQEASKVYKVNDFDGNAFVLIIDGATGDVLLDTWHDSLGNLMDYMERDFQLGDTIIEAMEKMKNDMSGDLAFISKTRGNPDDCKKSVHHGSYHFCGTGGVHGNRCGVPVSH